MLLKFAVSSSLLAGGDEGSSLEPQEELLRGVHTINGVGIDSVCIRDAIQNDLGHESFVIEGVVVGIKGVEPSD